LKKSKEIMGHVDSQHHRVRTISCLTCVVNDESYRDTYLLIHLGSLSSGPSSGLDYVAPMDHLPNAANSHEVRITAIALTIRHYGQSSD